MLSSASNLEPPKTLTRRKAACLLWSVVAALALAGIGPAVARRYQFALNETDSLPNWAFFIDKSQTLPDRGQFFEFIAPPNPYYPAGFRFTKRVAGVPGDIVSIKGREFFINGQSVGEAKREDKEGRVAIMADGGIIPPRRYFMMTPSRDSLDSRYAVIGLIEASRLVGRAYPVM